MYKLEERIIFFFKQRPRLSVVIAAAFFIFMTLYAIGASVNRARMTTDAPPKTFADDIRMGNAPIPAYTAAVAAKVASSTGFQVLLSYTDRGFEPHAVQIKAGETVRFTNNSSGDLWVAPGDGAVVYPRHAGSCGSSALDSCGAIVPQDFWEFTFARAGAWEVVNNFDKSKTVTVTVK